MLWGDVSEADSGQEVRQTCLLAELPDLFREVGEEWIRRWGRHDAVDPSRWNEVVAGLRKLADGRSMPLQPINECRFRQAVKKKANRTSPGPDGITKVDLTLIPGDLLRELLSILRHAEDTGEWPSQALTGIVVALEKKADACDVRDFRPITVLSLVYRTWSSIRSKEALHYISKVAPPLMFGNLPGAMWLHVQTVMEQAWCAGQPQQGFSADLVKAFNQLPRIPVLATCRAIGLHPIRAWAGALHELARRFRICGSTGPAEALPGLPKVAACLAWPWQ